MKKVLVIVGLIAIGVLGGFIIRLLLPNQEQN
jgi:preprotein translocase subunit Sss1